MQISSADSTSLSFNTLNQSIKNENETQLVCSFNKTSTLICVNKKCSQNSLICSDPFCDCKKQHVKCMKMDLQSFLMSIKQKPVKIDYFIQIIDQKIQLQIDYLSDFREKLIQKLKQEFEYFGMMDIEKQFLIESKDKKLQSIVGKKTWAILQNFEQKEKKKQIADISINKINEHFSRASKYLEDLQKTVFMELNNCNQKAKTFFVDQVKEMEVVKSSIKKPFNYDSFDSKIIKTFEQFRRLQNFFNSIKKVSRATLLYRASQNDFEVKKFHQNCDNIPNTLVLIETKKNKKIGGYSSNEWKSLVSFIHDESGSSFIFSLTEGDKFNLMKSDNAIFNNLKYGPTFGNGYDLHICNKSNSVNDSYANIDITYHNGKYRKNTKQSWQRFCGNENSKNFTTKQWQVWALEFDQKSNEKTNKNKQGLLKEEQIFGMKYKQFCQQFIDNQLDF